MNILASFDWLKEHVKKTPNVEEFVRRMTEVGNSVERVIDVGASLEKIVVGKILEVKAHPNADKLRVVDVLISSTLPKGEAGRGSVEIVCGGSNLEVGHLVAVALPGSRVRWHGEGDLVELQETEIRGVKSFGMVCAGAEIGFEKLKAAEHEIWDLTGITKAKAGTPLAKALGLDDLLFDIEVTTNRPDAMSIVGLAREAGAAGLGEFLFKGTDGTKVTNGTKDKVDVEVKEKKLCPRYQAVVIEGVTVKPSPWWMQKRLLLSGHRPINNVVDITNYILHELGQPLHAFDADKLDGGKIIVRKAKKGEKILALDEKEYALDSSMLVIADAKRPVAVAGVMGGEATGTTEQTTRLIIESANFDPVSIRRTARALTLYSDSSSQFEKSLSTESTAPAIARAIELICELTGGHVASAVADVRASRYKPAVFPYDPQAVSDRIGVAIPISRQKEILKRLGFKFLSLPLPKGRAGVGSGLRIEVPFWRDHDIEDSVDFSEEVARMYGYANLPSKMPTGEIPFVPKDTWLAFERKSKEVLAAAGCTELYSLAFTSEAGLKKLDLSAEDAIAITNPLSEDQSFMRPTLLGSLLEAVEFNQHRYQNMELFEISTVHHPRKNDLPDERRQLMIAVADRDGAFAFRRARGLTERWIRSVGAPSLQLELGATYDLAHPARCAELYLPSDDSERVGYIFEVSPDITRRFGVDLRVVVVELNLESVMALSDHTKRYMPPPEFPGVYRDVSILVDTRITYADLHRVIVSSHSLIRSAGFVDVYQSKGIELGKKSMTFNLELCSSDHTLTSAEAEQAIQAIQTMLQKDFQATLR